VDQRALGELAERAAELSELGDPAQLSALIGRAAREHRYSKGAVVRLIAGEWDRLGIRRVPRETLLGMR